MNRITFAFRAFFAILFGNNLPADIAQAFGYSRAMPVKAPPPTPKAGPGPVDGAVQILGILQRDARLVDFLMEDIAAYSDDQVGAAVRDVHAQAKQSLDRYMKLTPVIDAVEDTPVKTSALTKGAYKLIGNVPASGEASSGLLRHKGWQAGKVELPAAAASTVIAPAEIEVE